MSIDDDRIDDLTALEARLGGWRPSVGGLDRGATLYEAGRVAGLVESRRTVRALSAVAALLALATAGLGAAWSGEHRRGLALESALAPALKPAPEPVAIAPTLRDEPRATPPGPYSYLSLTRRIIDGEIDFDPPPLRSNVPPLAPNPTPLRVRDRDRLLNL